MDEPEEETELPVEGWRQCLRDPKGRLELNASPGVILDDGVLGKAKEGGAEVHAHRGVPAVTVVLERHEEEAEMSEGEGGGRGTHTAAPDNGPVVLASGPRHHRLTLTCSNICMVGKVLREQTKPSGLRKPATTFGTPRRND